MEYENVTLEQSLSLLQIRPTLPPELVDRIIDFLHDDWHALANCALASHNLLPRARHLLCSHVRLNDSNHLGFVDLLTSSVGHPTLPWFIQHLQLSWSRTSQDRYFLGFLPPSNPSYLLHTLAVAAPHLPALQHLTLGWTTTGAALPAMLAPCVHLRVLALTWSTCICAAMRALLAALPRLERIEWRNNRLASPEAFRADMQAAQGEFSVKTFCAASLSSNHTDVFLQWIARHAKLERMVVADIAEHWQHELVIPELLAVDGLEHIKELELGFSLSEGRELLGLAAFDWNGLVELLVAGQYGCLHQLVVKTGASASDARRACHSYVHSQLKPLKSQIPMVVIHVD